MGWIDNTYFHRCYLVSCHFCGLFKLIPWFIKEHCSFRTSNIYCCGVSSVVVALMASAHLLEANKTVIAFSSSWCGRSISVSKPVFSLGHGTLIKIKMKMLNGTVKPNDHAYEHQRCLKPHRPCSLHETPRDLIKYSSPSLLKNYVVKHVRFHRMCYFLYIRLSMYLLESLNGQQKWF